MFTIQSNAKEIAAHIFKIENDLKTEFFPKFSATAINKVQQEQLSHFKKQSGPDGTPWKPSKRAIRDHGQTLINNGILRDSMLGGAGGFQEVGDDYFYVGTRVSYASKNQYGFPARHIPARPFMGFSESFEVKMQKVASIILKDLFKNG